jgi:protein required for attachment to host cells
MGSRCLLYERLLAEHELALGCRYLTAANKLARNVVKEGFKDLIAIAKPIAIR